MCPTGYSIYKNFYYICNIDKLSSVWSITFDYWYKKGFNNNGNIDMVFLQCVAVAAHVLLRVVNLPVCYIDYY